MRTAVHIHIISLGMPPIAHASFPIAKHFFLYHTRYHSRVMVRVRVDNGAHSAGMLVLVIAVIIVLLQPSGDFRGGTWC